MTRATLPQNLGQASFGSTQRKARHICVAGVSGLAGAHIARAALASGWSVTGTLRDATDTSKTVPLMALSGARDRLRLVSADTAHPESFTNALKGRDALVIACLPSIRTAPDGTRANDLDPRAGMAHCVTPAKTACRNLITAADRNGIGDIVLLSSTASADPNPPPAIKDELQHHSDLEHQIEHGKFIAAQKTAMEIAATRLAQDRDLRLVILLSGMILGPGLLPCHDQGHVLGQFHDMAVKGRPWHRNMPNGSMSLIHPVDLASLCLAALQKPEAEGRYFAVAKSWQWSDIYNEISNFAPKDALPTAVPKGTIPAATTAFDFTRRDSLAPPRNGLPEMVADFYQWLDDRVEPKLNGLQFSAEPVGAVVR
ncbi:Nucleoside-diphosphate-sugar epimerase (plasmid) [Phaeobacter piscinae]|uniref:Nucleoside-diphosphate-sugar epimerase n=1 Tax=Phaeobacter piscinae TaxID=1580596 RepID=A0ABM7D8X2_9RHOB|nr:NAD-dependent epimerase/dehydratase family protein [Phaeobacter piscinae]ATG37634.1 Nucleoside-diphosphate-sugar epimerase [Phaeobacter piscinae]AUQ88155.1 Nucleoside-diphosphate-sugar epimerase [Phaeobacter piscinae]AUR26038.1 Nucleoside-diphosphate-sugar epimerase [Phaeobacter piscinae]